MFSIGKTALLFVALTIPSQNAHSESTQGHEDVPKSEVASSTSHEVGRKAATKYMGTHGKKAGNEKANGHPNRSVASTGGQHYLALHAGGYLSDTAYKWGESDSVSNIGKANLGVTYRVGEWVNSMDLSFRVDFSTFKLAEGSASKLSFLPVVTFPDASSRFPLYFGGGLGAGVFVSQVAQESSISFDYQLIAGARFFDVIGSTGFFVEGGLKNHLFLLSDGQFNGTFAAVGTVFSF